MIVERNIDVLESTELGELDTFTDLENKRLYVSFVFNPIIRN